MYPVSDAFMQEIESNARKYFWTGRITTKAHQTYEFSGEDIVKGSGYITRQCCGSTEVELLSDIDCYTLEGAEIKVYFHLFLPNNTVETVPMGIFYKAGGEYDDSVLWNGTLLPICPNMIGDILLFSKALEENADNIYVNSDNLPVAYASNNVNSTANTARGSLNLTESKALDNGYKFVWEFTPSQGNGTIAAVALTRSLGGQNGFGSLVGDTSPFLKLKAIDIGSLSSAKQMVLFELVEVDFNQNLTYSITFENSAVRIRKLRLPILSIGLNEKLDDSTYSVVEDKVIPTAVFLFLGSYEKYGEFMDGKDGYWYGFSNEGNAFGNAVML